MIQTLILIVLRILNNFQLAAYVTKFSSDSYKPPNYYPKNKNRLLEAQMMSDGQNPLLVRAKHLLLVVGLFPIKLASFRTKISMSPELDQQKSIYGLLVLPFTADQVVHTLSSIPYFTLSMSCITYLEFFASWTSQSHSNLGDMDMVGVHEGDQAKKTIQGRWTYVASSTQKLHQ